jgi:hypothetical protein
MEAKKRSLSKITLKLLRFTISKTQKKKNPLLIYSRFKYFYIFYKRYKKDIILSIEIIDCLNHLLSFVGHQ